MNMTFVKTAIAALAGVATLAACGNEKSGQGADPLAIAATTVVGTVMSRGKAKEPPAPPKTPEQQVAEALRVNPNPLIMVRFESLGKTQIMAMVGQNGNMRTYKSPADEALILRNGMVVGTRRLVNDLSVAEPQTEALIRSGRAGQAPRVMRYYTGDGRETPLRFDCSVSAGGQPGTRIEDCRGHGISFRNSFTVSGGAIPTSRQWIGPGVGYVTVQVLRP